MKLARISLTFLSYLSPLIFFLLLLLRFDLSQLFSFFLEAEPAWLLAGAALVPFSVVLLAVCWRFLLVPSSLPFRRLFFVLSRWAMAEQILPVRMSEGVKIFYFGMEDKMGKTRTLSAVFGEEVA
ncbi:MAG: flippase-like domain-containing protein, partial [Deltaproteobacteria bacterium]|nr:flippase-like domain-containing protein [Deltaproteobacteria bacterium]